jgi:hypothetical protein
MPPDQPRLDHRKVGELRGRFLVPDYQRGYRWGAHEVRALLDDIWENGQRDYSLQPVVVMPTAAVQGREAEWELVDGQQRLTTLHLVYRYIHAHLPKAPPAYSLCYRTRPETEGFLRDEVYLDDEALPLERWSSNADFFHLRRAWQEVRAWFESVGKDPSDVALDMRSLLANHVKVIWYEAEDIDARALFTRLNIGRIALRNAELVKALLLARTTRWPGTGDGRDSGGAPVLRAEASLAPRPSGDAGAVESASQWDAIERDLRDPAFWAFLTNAKEDEYPARIELLLDLLARRPPGRGWRRYQTFDTLRPRLVSDATQFWHEVLDLHARLREWFEDPARFHQVGFLVATGEIHELTELLALAKGVRRSALDAALVARIRTRLKLGRTELGGLSYTEDSRRCHTVLLLANIATAMRAGEGRFPFHRHKGVRAAWSLEHIHAQQSEGLDSNQEWSSWLDLHVDALASLPAPPSGTADAREAMRARIARERDDLTRESFRALAADVIALFSTGAEEGSDWVHSLSNLALLPSDANTALGNSVFAVKRRAILALDQEGTYIPPSTRRVFLKYYSADATPQLQFWSAADRRAYEQALVDVLGPYLEDR